LPCAASGTSGLRGRPETVPVSVERSFGVGAHHVSRKLKALGHDNRLPIRVFCAQKRSAITKFDNDDTYAGLIYQINRAPTMAIRQRSGLRQD
jgi:hypothetical protein